MYDKIRLIVTRVCKRKCENCVNKNMPVKPIPMTRSEVMEHPASEIYVTGGEPMLLGNRLRCLLEDLRGVRKRVYLYSAEYRDIREWCRILHLLDGITLTVHKADDVASFLLFANFAKKYTWLLREKSLRLNIFEESLLDIDLAKSEFPEWHPKQIKRFEDCPMPEGELLAELEY